MKNYSRREMLKTAGMVAASTPFVNLFANQKPDSLPIVLPVNPEFKKLDRPVTAIVIGAGNRGNTYAAYSEKFPYELKIVGVAEPIELRRKRFAKRYNIPDENQWITWEHVLLKAKLADALIITTPDNLHYGPAMGGLKLDYDLLLEKPIAQTWQECSDILKLTEERKRIVAVCHVLRYAPYFRKLKEVIDSGILGKIVSVQHLEPVLHQHMAHSYVRGNWRNTREAHFMLLAKSCHDLDILRWLIGKECRSVSSFGALSLFKKENAPEGSTLRCTDGCKIESECPYSALRIYYRNRTYLHHFDFAEGEEKGEAILKHLKEGPYGRCVYHCDNDVVDHQVVAMEFEEKITTAFSMEAFTSYDGRRTRIMGTMGDAVGDMTILTVNDFRTGKQTVWDASKDAGSTSGHGGGDFGLAHDWIQAVGQQNPSLLSSTLQASMESHLIGFRAEESRLTGKTVQIEKI